MKILVSGSTGFLGSALLKSVAVNDDIELWLFVRKKPCFSQSNLHYIILEDLESNDRLPTFDVIFHLAALISYNDDDCNALFDSNVALTRMLCSLKCKRFVYASSVSVFGQSSEPINERSAIQPWNSYAQSKYWGEHLVAQLPSFAILRFSSLFGEGMALTTFLPRMILQAVNENQICVFGNGTRLQNYLHIDQAVQYLWAAAKVDSNITGLAVGAESVSNKTAAEKIAALTSAEIVFTGEDNSPSFVYDNAQTKKTLGMALPGRNFYNDLESLYQWIKSI